jgi:hypothetical protein
MPRGQYSGVTDLKVTLEAPEFAPPRQRIEYSVVVENEGESTIEAHLLGREPVHDLTVTGKGGEVVWRRLTGEIGEAILRLDMLAPRQSLRIAGEWDQRNSAGQYVAPGFYTLQATVPTDTIPLISQDCLLHITD